MGMSADPLDTIFEHRDPVKKPGWRKALPWIVAVAVVATGVALLIVFVRNTGHSSATPLNPNVPAVDVSKVPKTALIEVALLPKPKSNVKAAMFMMELDKINGKWLVNSWVPRSVPFVHSQGDQ